MKYAIIVCSAEDNFPLTGSLKIDEINAKYKASVVDESDLSSKRIIAKRGALGVIVEMCFEELKKML